MQVGGSYLSDHYTLEAAVRCPSNRPTGCPIQLLLLNGPSSGYVRATSINTLPANNQWYICRLDLEHGFANPFPTPSSVMTLRIRNHSEGNADVDQVHLLNASQRVEGTVGDPLSPPSSGSTCTPASNLN